jgi:hypothetical protein
VERRRGKKYRELGVWNSFDEKIKGRVVAGPEIALVATEGKKQGI